MRSPKERQRHSHEPGHILPQLSAALENPDIKALEWSEDGQVVLIHTKLYEEEMERNKELFPELLDLGCVVKLQTWLVAYGFRLKEEKVNSSVLLLQHPNFQRPPPTAKEPRAFADNAGLSAKKKKKKEKKKKRHASTFHPFKKAMSQDTLGQPLHQRPFYQYINFNMLLELMKLSAEEDEVPGLAEPSRVHTDIRSSTALHLEDTWASSTSEAPAPAVGDIYVVDMDGMLKHAAAQVPMLFSQYK